MKIRVLSDLHLEFGPFSYVPCDEDVLVLAGDTGIHTEGMVWVKSVAMVPTVVIAGNHEYYRGRSNTVEETIVACRSMSNDVVNFLENEIIVIDGVRFICATLWTDFNLYNNRIMSELIAIRMLNDFIRIRCKDGIFTPARSVKMHLESRRFIEEELNRPFLGRTVVITHHLPSVASIHPRYGVEPLNACFASNLDDLVVRSGAVLWVHGHTHESCDYSIGRTRVVCNPRGYVGHELNPNFKPNLVVEV